MYLYGSLHLAFGSSQGEGVTWCFRWYVLSPLVPSGSLIAFVAAWLTVGWILLRALPKDASRGVK